MLIMALFKNEHYYTPDLHANISHTVCVMDLALDRAPLICGFILTFLVTIYTV